MPLNKTIKREFEVAFSKHAQPAWFRIVKYIVLVTVIWFFSGSRLFWILFGVLFILAMCLHFWYRYKTNGWRKSYGMWNYEKNKSKYGDGQYRS
jgi:hypothetical protein